MDAEKDKCWFSMDFPDTHDYFLRRPKAGRLHPSSKSGLDMIISCGDLRLVGSTRHQKVSQNPHSILSRSGWWPCGSVGWCSKSCTRTFTIYGVARSPVGGPADRWGDVQKSCTRAPTLYRRCWPVARDLVGVLVVAPGPCGSMGWCSKGWGGAPKSCTRTPTLYTTFDLYHSADIQRHFCYVVGNLVGLVISVLYVSCYYIQINRKAVIGK